jgi:PadR family transcriptional regulator, regulatory protein AphA
MSTEVRAGPVSYVVLGIVALRGPSTSYDLKRFVQLSVGHFWPFPHTQLYAEPARLAEAGLLEETREEIGRRRRHYTITAAGRQRLAEWLGEPVSTPTEYRDLGLLKFFFAELAQPGDVIALAHEQAAAQRAQQTGYETTVARFGNRPDRPELASRVRSAELGIRLARTAAEFWEEILERETQVDAA